MVALVAYTIIVVDLLRCQVFNPPTVQAMHCPSVSELGIPVKSIAVVVGELNSSIIMALL